MIAREGDLAFFLAGDTSYTGQTLIEHAVDGVSPEETVARETQRQICAYARDVPTVYPPSHDPDAAAQLATRQVARVRG